MTDVVRHLEAGCRPERALAARSGNNGQIAPNGHAALVGFEIRGDPDKAVDKIRPVLDTVDELQAAHPAVFVGEFGDASKIDAVVTAYGDDLGKAGLSPCRSH